MLVVDPFVQNPINITIDTTICDGDSVIIAGNSYSTQGNYLVNLMDQFGCDSIININLIILAPITETINSSICQGDTITFEGQSYSSTGTYTINTTSSNGCDSTITLNLFVNQNIEVTIDETICTGDSLILGMNTYFQSGTYIDTLIASGGCDSIITLNLSVLDELVTDLSDTICEGDSAVIGTTTYLVSGQYSQTFLANSGCDSIVNLELVVIPHRDTLIEAHICVGETFSAGGQLFTASGSYSIDLNSSLGCDSTITLELTVHNPFDTTIVAEICEGESISVGSQTYSTSGVFVQMHTTVFGCDSAIIVDLTVHPIFDFTLNQTICEGSSVTISTNTYTESGTYTETLNTVHGCDSIIILNLQVLNGVPIELEATICAGESFLFGGQSISTSGIYRDTLLSSSSCDSIVELTLIVADTNLVDMDIYLCEGETFDFNGTPITIGGTFLDTLQNINGCDSIIHLDVTITPIYETAVNVEICEDELYDFNGVTLSSAGIYTDTLASVDNCDSIITLTLTVYPVPFTMFIVQICDGDSYDFLGTNLNQSGTYSDTLLSTHNCDSIITLNLIVNPVSTITVSDSICVGETYIFGDEVLTNGGTYLDTLPNISGCDSTIELTLVILPVFYENISAFICQGDSYLFGGNDLVTSGSYVDTLLSSNGCDSILSLDLMVNTSYEETLSVSICEGETYLFDNTLRDSTGIYSIL